MPDLHMNGPYLLDTPTIDRIITLKSPGNYALGRLDGSSFPVRYVGRSDTDLNERLKDHVGSPTSTHFMCSYASSPLAAFEKECHNYHDFNPPENKVHPARPAGTNWQCPRCGVFARGASMAY